jgi:hypothetical protein
MNIFGWSFLRFVVRKKAAVGSALLGSVKIGTGPTLVPRPTPTRGDVQRQQGDDGEAGGVIHVMLSDDPG